MITEKQFKELEIGNKFLLDDKQVFTVTSDYSVNIADSVPHIMAYNKQIGYLPFYADEALNHIHLISKLPKIEWQSLYDVESIPDNALCVVAFGEGEYILCRYDKKSDSWKMPNGGLKMGGSAVCIVGDAPEYCMDKHSTLDVKIL